MTTEEFFNQEHAALQQAQRVLSEIMQAQEQAAQNVLRCQGAVQALQRLMQTQQAPAPEPEQSPIPIRKNATKPAS